MSISSSGQCVGSVEDMPASFEGKMALLEEILQSSMEKLLMEAKKRDCIKAPFGKTPYPTPLISEEDFFKSGAWKEDLHENNEPTFEYNYGFNPLRFLGELVQWAHPNTAVARREAKRQAFLRLQSIGQHALRRFETLADLNSLTNKYRSGILWGPVTSLLNCNSVLVLCQPLRSGAVILQTSLDANFEESETVTVEYNLHTSAEAGDYIRDFKPARIDIANLIPGKMYYIRCCLKSGEMNGDRPRFDGLENNFFSSSTFWTLPNDVIVPPQLTDDADQHSEAKQAEAAEIVYSPISIWMIDAKGLMNDKGLGEGQGQGTLSLTAGGAWKNWPNSIISSTPQLSCILGDPFSSAYNSNNNNINNNNNYRSKIFELHRKSPYLNNSESILNSTSVLLAWNDSRTGSDVDLRSEEQVYKQYRHDLKKYEKKNGLDKKASSKKAMASAAENAPVHVRPPIANSLQSIADAFPMVLEESGATRSLNRVINIGPDMQFFLCDSRSGYMGKSQAKWLRDEIEASQSLWKIVLCGVPFGSKVYEVAPSRNANRSQTVSINPANPPSSDLPPLNSELQLQLPGEESGESKAEGGSSFRRDRSVSVMLPNAVDHDDLDESGVPKSSIQYVISSIQKRIDSKIKEASLDGGGSEVSSQVSSKGKLDIASTEDLLHTMSASTILPCDGSVLLESGILVVSSGGLAPFAATYDPCDWGRPFLAEVQVGSNSSENLREENYSSISPHYIFRGESSGDCTCNISLASDGGLVVSLLSGSNVVNQSVFKTTQKS